MQPLPIVNIFNEARDTPPRIWCIAKGQSCDFFLLQGFMKLSARALWFPARLMLGWMPCPWRISE